MRRYYFAGAPIAAMTIEFTHIAQLLNFSGGANWPQSLAILL
jgi:hypothetical protein